MLDLTPFDVRLFETVLGCLASYSYELAKGNTFYFKQSAMLVTNVSFLRATTLPDVFIFHPPLIT